MRKSIEDRRREALERELRNMAYAEDENRGERSFERDFREIEAIHASRYDSLDYDERYGSLAF